jgi:hypothetical protein
MIVGETCRAIWEVLTPKYMPEPDVQKWIAISQKFYEMWQMPNCVGSIDGKHIRVKCPQKSGSAFRNYLSFFSFVFLAVADAEGQFILACIGDYGRNSDGCVLKNSSIGKKLFQQQLNLPPAKKLPNADDVLLFFFVGDEAFPLGENIMRPYPQKTLTNCRRVFNARLSRARKTVECAFGRLASKFRCLHTPLGCSINKAVAVVQAAVILHNFVYRNDRRIEQSEDVLLNLGEQLDAYSGRSPRQALANRDIVKEYFLKDANALPWQYQYCV